ncbi:Crp/Fnr family transcriptional regulator [Thalassospira alkalitolerans]|uniref:Crp/Fnr family transcriptional regulator n=1 Tax=Thalassospira alkalitolerans TaxID=1293890 RepID=UPI003AA89F0F
MRSRQLFDTDIDIVKQVPFLSALGAARLSDLIGKCRVEWHAKGEHLFRAGDVADHFYILLSGHLRLVKISPLGEETVMHFLTQPGAFAEAVSLAGRAYPVECEVMENCEIVAIPREAYLTILRSAPDVAGDVLAGLIRWERFFLEEIYKLRHTKPIQRIASFLIDFEERNGENLDGEDETNFPEKRQIASRIGITPETFSRSLRKLEATGAIAAGPKLRILDRAALYELSR